MTTKKSAYINKKGFIEAVESSNFLEGKALAAQIEEAAELLTDDEFFDVKPMKELMKTLHGERRWSWGLRREGKIKIFNEVVDSKLKDDEWRESLLPQIEKKRDEIAKEGLFDLYYPIIMESLSKGEIFHEIDIRAGRVKVSAYTRDDGTHVEGYYRRYPQRNV